MSEVLSPDERSSDNGWSDQLTAYLKRTRGSRREICAFEPPLALDRSSWAAATSSFSLRDASNLLTDTSNRWTKAVSSGELLRVGTGTATFEVYRKDPGGSLLPWAIDEDACHAVKSMDRINARMSVNREQAATGGVLEDESATECHVVRVPPSDARSEPLIVMVCNLHLSLDESQVRGCADELSRAFAAILSSRLGPPLEKCP